MYRPRLRRSLTFARPPAHFLVDGSIRSSCRGASTRQGLLRDGPRSLHCDVCRRQGSRQEWSTPVAISPAVALRTKADAGELAFVIRGGQTPSRAFWRWTTRSLHPASTSEGNI